GALRDAARGDAAVDSLMLTAAQLARRAWERAGTWVHVERADYVLALCLVALGQGAAAVASAQACLARCEAEDPDDACELFFAHACNVQAQHSAGDMAAAARHRAQMVALLARIQDGGMRQSCEQTLAGTPQ
ncbi:MAG: hypothetical protein WAQ05_04085, partial [Rubrivivax sp.]